MAGKTTIEWTDASWNFVTGCDEVSPGCDHCYAKILAERFRGSKAFPQGFDLVLHPDRLQWPLKEKKPQRIFVNSMSDLFHKDISDDFILQGFETMLEANWHTYQILTKRPSRLVNTSLCNKILSLMKHKKYEKWPSHIWLGVSVEMQQYTWRIEKLLQVPAPIRFVSAEPLLGPLVLQDYLNCESYPDVRGLAWLITGAESGHGARPMNEEWVRELRDQCVEAGIAFFYKQNAHNGHKIPTPELDGKIWKQYPKETM